MRSNTIARAPSTPPTMVSVEAATARMFGPTDVKAKSVTKKFAGLLRRKSTEVPSGHHTDGPVVSLPTLPHHHHLPVHLPTPDGWSHHPGPLNPLNSLQPHYPHLPQQPESFPVPDHHALDELVRSLGITDAVHNITDAITSAPLPALSEAAQITMSILGVVSTGIRGYKYNEIGAKSLAAHVVNLISYIISAQNKRRREGRPVEPGLEEQLNQLLHILRDIQAFLEEQGHRSRISKAVTYKSDAQKLNSQREILSNALAEFQLRYNVNDQDRITRIDKRLQDIKRNMVDAMANPDAPALVLPPNFPQPRSSNRPPSTVPSRHFSRTPLPSNSHIGPSTAPGWPPTQAPLPSSSYINPSIVPSRPPSRAPIPSRPPSRAPPPNNFSYLDPSTMPPLPQNYYHHNPYTVSRPPSRAPYS